MAAGLGPSTKGFREQTKKPPISMQEGKKDDNFDPEDEPNNDQVPPIRSDGEEPEAETKDALNQTEAEAEETWQKEMIRKVLIQMPKDRF